MESFIGSKAKSAQVDRDLRARLVSLTVLPVLQRHIANGRSAVRRVLHMAALAACRHNLISRDNVSRHNS